MGPIIVVKIVQASVKEGRRGNKKWQYIEIKISPADLVDNPKPGDVVELVIGTPEEWALCRLMRAASAVELTIGDMKVEVSKLSRAKPSPEKATIEAPPPSQETALMLAEKSWAKSLARKEEPQPQEMPQILTENAWVKILRARQST